MRPHVLTVLLAIGLLAAPVAFTADAAGDEACTQLVQFECYHYSCGDASQCRPEQCSVYIRGECL